MFQYRVLEPVIRPVAYSRTSSASQAAVSMSVVIMRCPSKLGNNSVIALMNPFTDLARVQRLP
jgi:hypothetical protein